MGNTMYYTKATGMAFAELRYALEPSAAGGGYSEAEVEPNKEQTSRRKCGAACDYV